MSVLNHKVVIALGTSAYDNAITQRKISIEKLFANLSTPKIQKKKDGQYFIFASFNGDTRNAQSVKQYYGATIDLDDTPLSVDDIRKKFSKYVHCIYTTFSHNLPGKGDRYRLVIPYKAPLDAITHVETMLYIMSRLGVTNVDTSSKALSRPMYLPATSRDRKDEFEFYSTADGFLFNPMSSKVREAIAQLSFEQAELFGQKEQFDINGDVAEGDRNNSLARAVGKFIKTGVAVSELLPLAYAWNQQKLSPPLSEKEVRTIVQSIVKAHSRNHNDLDWGFDEIISRVKASEKIDSDYEHILDMVAAAKSKSKLKPSQVQMVINAISTKAKLGKRVIAQELSQKELQLQGQIEEAAEANIETASTALKKEFKNWVFVASDDRFYNIKTGEYFKKEAFGSMFATPNVEGSLVNMLMKFNLVRKVSRLEFDPTKSETYTRDGIKYANTYIPPDIFPLPGDVGPMVQHFEYLISDEYERNILLDFIAYMVQYPGEKIRWMPIIKGGKGIGKTIIAEKIIMPLLGFVNFSKVSNDVIKSDFNGWQLNKQLIVFEELDIGANQAEKIMLTDKLKSFITDNIITAHRKGLDPYDVVNKANAMGFTNKEDAIIISPDERRFCMIRTAVRPKGERYYGKLARFADKHLAEMYYFFMERDVSKFSVSRAPETGYTREIKGQSMGWPMTIINDWLSNPDHPFNAHGCATNTQISAAIQSESTGRYRVLSEDLEAPGSAQSKRLYITLREMGFIQYQSAGKTTSDSRIFLNGKKETVWILPDHTRKLMAIPPNGIKQRIKKIKIKDQNWK